MYVACPFSLICSQFLQVAALKGYENANSIAMDLWEEVYSNALLIALTDTFSSETFFKVFNLTSFSALSS